MFIKARCAKNNPLRAQLKINSKNIFTHFVSKTKKNGERSWKIPKKETHDHEIAHISN